MDGNDKIVRLPQAIEICGLSRATLRAKIDPESKGHDPEFPKPVRISSRAVGWRNSDLQSWIQGRRS